VLERFQPPVVSFHFGLPSPELLARVRAMGSRVIASATTLEEALWLQERGVDAVIAQGLEAGGHRGHFLSTDVGLQTGMLALVAQCALALRVPVIAAGGIGDAASVRAAMAAGIDERVKLSVLVAGGEDWHAEVAVGEVAAGARQLRRQANHLCVLLEERFPLTLGQRRVGIHAGGAYHDPTRVAGGLGVHLVN
jgi:hypothetical protein